MRHSRGSSRSRSSGRKQNESSRRRGGQSSNGNAKKVLEWLESYDLSSPAGLDSFMQEVIQRVWRGELGTRAASSINGTLRLLLEHMTLPGS